MQKRRSNDLIQVSNRWEGESFLIERHPTRAKINAALYPGFLRRSIELFYNSDKRQNQRFLRTRLAAAYLSHPDPHVRLITISLIKGPRTLAVLQTLVDLLADPSRSIRLAAAEALWEDTEAKPSKYSGVQIAIRCLRDEIRRAAPPNMSVQQAREALEILRTTRPTRWEDFNAWLVNEWCFPYDNPEDEMRPYTYGFFFNSVQAATQGEDETKKGLRQLGIKIDNIRVLHVTPDFMQETPVDDNHRQEVMWNGISIPSDNSDALMGTLVEWYNLNTDYCDKRRFLETHLELLDIRCDSYLNTLIEMYPTHIQYLRAHKLLLENARKWNNAPGAVRKAYIDMYGALFTLDLPSWLSKMMSQIVRLLSYQWQARTSNLPLSNLELLRRYNMDLSQIVQTEVVHILLLRNVLTYAQTDTGVAPEILAALRFHLASVLRKDKNGNLRQALDEAIGAYQASLEIYTSDCYPQRYALIQQELAITYQDRITGSKRDNLEQAIACCNAALSVLTPAEFPVGCARNQSNLGTIYLHRIVGKREKNLEDALHCYSAAQQIFNHENYPFNWAIVKRNLAEVCRNRIVGSRVENLEAAIRACRNALLILTLKDFPEEFALTFTKLSSIYNERIAGKPQDNIEEAIDSCKIALRVFNEDDFPMYYATLQSNLGTVYQRRIVGSRQNNLERAVTSLTNALKVFTLEEFPINHRDTQLSLADLTFNVLIPDAERYGINVYVRKAYTNAHQAFMAARRAQTELGWLESDEQGRTSLSSHPLVREMYANDAWCLWELGDLREAVVTLEAGRAQALVEAQAIAGVTLDRVCEQHATAFVAARQHLQDARRGGDRIMMRTARDAFLQVRQDVHSHCVSDFLPDEPTYQDIANASAADQAILYLTATRKGGLAFLVPPAQGDLKDNNSPPIVIPLPQLTLGKVDEWFMRLDNQKNIVGGYLYTLQYRSVELLWHWIETSADGREWEQRQTMSLRDVVDALPFTMVTLHNAMQDLVNAWRLRTDPPYNCEMPLGEALHSNRFVRDLTWFLQKAELDYLLPDFRQTCMEALYHELHAHGFGNRDQRLALIPCGRLGVLPIHAAWVGEDANTGELIPFQQTCELTIQPSARTLATARVALATLPSIVGPIIAVGDPQLREASSLPQLKWARAESQAIVNLFLDRGLQESKAFVGKNATLTQVIDELRAIRLRRSGSWVHIASHGHADPSNPNKCYLVLAGSENLTLAMLQRERLLEGTRLFTASGCVTGLGDFEYAPDELSSLAAGILQAGSPCAVATLWPVSDHPTFLLMLRFVFNMLSSQNPARAMRDAANWLRHATREELRVFENDNMAELLSIRGGDDQMDNVLRSILEIPSHADKNPTPMGESFLGPATGTQHVQVLTPYVHAVYWASTVVYGI